MLLPLTILFSPILMAIFTVFVVVFVRMMGIQKPSIARLLALSLIYAAIGLMASLAYTIIEMARYEAATGFSAGNGPLGWIFLYGPLSAAMGQFVALTQWWLKKVPKV